MAILNPAEQFDKIKKSAISAIEQMFPVEGRTHSLILKKVWIEDSLNMNDYKAQFNAMDKDRTWGVPVYVDMELIDNETKKVVDKESKMKLMSLPKATSRGSYIVKGNEYTFTNQLRLKPGAYTIASENGDLRTFVNMGKGKSFNMTQDPSTNIFRIEIGQGKRKLYPLLKALGVSEQKMKDAWGTEVYDANKSAEGNIETEISGITEAVYGKGKSTKDYGTNLEMIKTYMKGTEISPETTKITLGESFNKMDGDMLLSASKKLFQVHNGEKKTDDRDSLAFKDLHSAEDFIKERLVKSRRQLLSKVNRNLNAKTKINQIINSKNFSDLIVKEFTGPSHANVGGQTNPATMATNFYRTTVTGEGGVSSAHQMSLAMRSLSL